MPKHKTNQFWKDPEFLRLIRKQREMFRRRDKQDQQWQADESVLESDQRSSGALENGHQQNANSEA